MEVGNFQAGDKLTIFLANFIKYRFLVIDQIHLVDGQNDMLDTEQRDDKGVASSLSDDPGSSVNQDNCQVGG